MALTKKRKIRVLLTGLDQDIYENFISAVERTPYDTYAEVQRAVEGYSTKPRVLAALRGVQRSGRRTPRRGGRARSPS